MTEINHLKIEDFKGIQNLEMDVGNINIITGKNNSGKTSLLQALNLAFNPRQIGKFGENVDKLVNVHKQTASITCGFIQPQYTLDSDFTAEEPGRVKRDLEIRKPSDREILDNMGKVLQNLQELNEDYSRVYLQEFEEEIKGEIQEAVQEEVSSISAERLLRYGREAIVIFEIENTPYPYIYLGQSFDELREDIVKSSMNNLVNNIDVKIKKEQEREWLGHLENSIGNILTPRFGRGRFVREVPEGIEGLKAVFEVKTEADKFDLDQENAAIRRRKIEKFLLSNNIIEDLDDFSFDKIVFEKQGEEPYEIPFDFMGDGFKIIIGVLWELFDEDRENQVLLLEEPENHMHPGFIEGIVKELVRISEEKQIQLFITTHNLDFVESFFSPAVAQSYEGYLKEEFRLMQLTDPVRKVFNYGQAEERVEELNVDLRGV